MKRNCSPSLKKLNSCKLYFNAFLSGTLHRVWVAAGEASWTPALAGASSCQGSAGRCPWAALNRRSTPGPPPARRGWGLQAGSGARDKGMAASRGWIGRGQNHPRHKCKPGPSQDRIFARVLSAFFFAFLWVTQLLEFLTLF